MAVAADAETNSCMTGIISAGVQLLKSELTRFDRESMSEAAISCQLPMEFYFAFTVTCIVAVDCPYPLVAYKV
jgi:hypothetical protein